jgi:hypothetical protein
MHKADDCFSLAKNEEKMKSGRIREWEVPDKKGGMTSAGAE